MQYGIKRRIDHFGYCGSRAWARLYEGKLKPVAWGTGEIYYGNKSRMITFKTRQAAERLRQKLQSADKVHEYKLYDSER